MRGVVWFKEDLRTIDNTALHHAAKQCDDGVVAIYLLDPAMWQQHEVAACRVNFLLRGVAKLKENLAKLNIPLLIIKLGKGANVAKILLKHVNEVKAEALYFNRQYEINELTRDQAVEKYLTQNQIKVCGFDDLVIFAPGTIKNGQGQDYKVFTAFKNAWIKKFREASTKSFPAPKAQSPLRLAVKSLAIPEHINGFKSVIDPALWPVGQEVALKRLHKFVDNNLFNYHETRDFPAIDGTSKLSPYLNAGMISSRQCFLNALDANNNELESGNKGATTWLGEFIWREFYKHILIAAPRVSKHQAYQQKTDKLRWDYNEKQFQAWQSGQTGYPLIDAAMRQLNTLGWMHNRLRMVVAMFLTKNLFFDWRLGEKYFITHLIDGDLAANNGGWQWSASTGTDSAPYFRIFNPIRQSERFDPDGKFILEYCPELKSLNKKAIHEPYKSQPDVAAKQGYPKPIVDLRSKRDKVLAAYKKISA
jgi:deoxyribodipyrimidine photo-lyase